jgi:putative membrane protein
MTRRLLVSAALLALGAFSPLQAQSSQTSQPDTQQQQGTTGSQDQQGTMGSQSQQGSISDSDRDFAKTAYQDNLAEISVGQLAVQRASNNDVKQYAQELVDDHTKANDQLKQIATSKGIDLPSEVDSQAKSEQDRLSQVSGSDFDRQFLDQEKKDHQKAIALFQQEASQGQDPDLKSYASENLSKLQQHASMADHISGSTGSDSASSNQGGQGKYGPENAYGPGTTSSYPSSTANPDQTGQSSTSSSSSSATSASPSTTTTPDQSTSSSSSSDQTGQTGSQSNMGSQNSSQNPDQTGTASSSSQSTTSQNDTTTSSTTSDQGTTSGSRNAGGNSRALPRTASNLPLFGLSGLLLIGAGLVMRSFRMVRNNG